MFKNNMIFGKSLKWNLESGKWCEKETGMEYRKKSMMWDKVRDENLKKQIRWQKWNIERTTYGNESWMK